MDLPIPTGDMNVIASRIPLLSILNSRKDPASASACGDVSDGRHVHPCVCMWAGPEWPRHWRTSTSTPLHRPPCTGQRRTRLLRGSSASKRSYSAVTIRSWTIRRCWHTWQSRAWRSFSSRRSSPTACHCWVSEASHRRVRRGI